jgi:hypothetical protein
VGSSQCVINSNLVNSFKQSSKSNTISKSDRKNLQMSNDYASQPSKEKKRVIPELKFPMMSSLDQMMTRSSRRADFSKSGGSTSGHTNINNRSNVC